MPIRSRKSAGFSPDGRPQGSLGTEIKALVSVLLVPQELSRLAANGVLLSRRSSRDAFGAILSGVTGEVMPVKSAAHRYRSTRS